MTLVFLHIDKTGGLTVQRLLAQQFNRCAIRPVPHMAKVSVTLDYPTTHANLPVHHRAFHHNPVHQLVMGHYDWSVVGYIPKPIVITVLREPVARLVSLYRFICAQRAAYGEFSILAEGMGLDAFARRYTGLYANTMTAQLAGIRWSQAAQVDEAAFEQAVTNLRQCAVVGVTERLDDFIRRVFTHRGWPEPGTITPVNVGQWPEITVEEETRALIADRCAWDGQLYQIAKELSQG